MIDIFQWMLEELEGSYPVTVKVPSQQGGYIRVPVSKNPEWYSELCKRHIKQRVTRFRKPRTIIKRRDTLAALRRLIEGDDSGVYAERILEVANEFASAIKRAMRKARQKVEYNLPEF